MKMIIMKMIMTIIIIILIIGLVDGMEKALNMDYRPTATKIVCIITDAPPHGLGTAGDSFPAGIIINHF